MLGRISIVKYCSLRYGPCMIPLVKSILQFHCFNKYNLRMNSRFEPD